MVKGRTILASVVPASFVCQMQPWPRLISVSRLAMNSSQMYVLIAWGVVTAAFLALLAYNATLTRYEEDQLFLSDANTREQELQNEIQKNVNRMRPLIRASGGASALLAAVIIGMYTWEAWQRLR